MVIKAFEKLEERRNDLIGRVDITLEAVVEGGTPSRAEVIEAATRLLGVEEGRMTLVKIDPEFGKNRALVRIRVYDFPEGLRLFEPNHRVARVSGEAKKKG